MAGALLMLSGCGGGFFTRTTTTTTPTTNTTGDFVYVANASTSTIAAFSVATSTAGVASLSTISGSPYATSLIPTSIVVTPSNAFLYVAGLGGIYGYAINATTGALTSVASGGAVAVTNFASVSMDVSPDGQWLFALNSDNATINEYAINTSTGALSIQASPTYSLASGAVASARMIKIAPSGGYVFVALGTGGDLVYPFTTSTGTLGTPLVLNLGSTTTSDNALAVNSTSTYLYIARSGSSTGLAVYTIGTGGALNAVTGSPFAAGNGPYDVQLDSTGKYVYVANRTDGTISGFLIGTGSVLTALSGSPYASGSLVRSLVRDNSDTYLLAAASGGSPDLTMYSFDATLAGKLNTVVTATTGTDPTGALMVAATH